MEASAIMAAVAYDAATRDEMLPLEPLPKPEPPRRPGGRGRPARDRRRRQLTWIQWGRPLGLLRVSRPALKAKKDRALVDAPGRGAPAGRSEDTTHRGGRRSSLTLVSPHGPGNPLPSLIPDNGPIMGEAPKSTTFAFAERKQPGAEIIGMSSLYDSSNRLPGSTGAETVPRGRPPFPWRARPHLRDQPER